MSCGCRCHVNPGAGCDEQHDTGSSGVAGGWSCSPCDHNETAASENEACTVCDAAPGEPHIPVEGDCILPHRYTRREHPPRATIGWCCAGCIHRHRYWLAQIDELWTTLHHVTELGSVPDTTAEHQRPKKAPASPAPYRVVAWAFFQRIRASVHPDTGDPVTDRATLIPALLGEHMPRITQRLDRWVNALRASGWNADDTSSPVFVLRRAAEHIAAQSWVDQYDAELAWIRRALRRAHGLPDNDEPLGRCLTITDGRDCGGTVRNVPNGAPRCDRCRRSYETSHDLMRLKVTEEHRRRERNAS